MVDRVIRRLLKAEPVAVHDDLQRVADIVEIVQRLAHAHHDDVGQHPPFGLGRPFAERVAGEHHLADDLRRLEVAHQPHRAGVAEGAIERAADLARHAQGAAVGVGDEHHLEVMAVVGAQQPFAGAVGRHLRLDHFGPRDDEALGEPRLLRLGDVGHRRKVADPAIVDPVPHLLGAQLGLPRLEPRRFERGADRVLAAGRPARPGRRRAAARARARARDRSAPGIGIKVVSALMASRLSREVSRFASAALACQRSRRRPRRSRSARRRADSGRRTAGPAPSRASTRIDRRAARRVDDRRFLQRAAAPRPVAARHQQERPVADGQHDARPGARHAAQPDVELAPARGRARRRTRRAPAAGAWRRAAAAAPPPRTRSPNFSAAHCPCGTDTDPPARAASDASQAAGRAVRQRSAHQPARIARWQPQHQRRAGQCASINCPNLLD